MTDPRLEQLYEQASSLQLELAASIIAIEPHARSDFVAECVDRRRWVHADVIEGAYRGQPGVDLADLHKLAATSRAMLDAHLMVDDPVTLARSGQIPRVARITVEVPPSVDPGEAVDALRPFGDEVWVSGEHPAWHTALAECGSDGYLLMLTPPGRPGYSADLTRLADLRSAPAHLRIGVDGGVRGEHFGELAAHGVGYAVVGRALHPR